MSTISSSGLTDTTLARAGLEPLGGQGSVDSLRARDQGFAGLEFDASLDGDRTGGAQPLTDSGEDVLNASAWDDTSGVRMLDGDTALESSLGAMPLSEAADSAADAVFSALY